MANTTYLPFILGSVARFFCGASGGAACAGVWDSVCGGLSGLVVWQSVRILPNAAPPLSAPQVRIRHADYGEKNHRHQPPDEAAHHGPGRRVAVAGRPLVTREIVMKRGAGREDQQVQAGRQQDRSPVGTTARRVGGQEFVSWDLLAEGPSMAPRQDSNRGPAYHAIRPHITACDTRMPRLNLNSRRLTLS